jgi:hypothetical protein
MRKLKCATLIDVDDKGDRHSTASWEVAVVILHFDKLSFNDVVDEREERGL